MWKLILIALCWLLSALPAQAITLVQEDFEGTATQIAARWPGQSYCCFPNSGGPFNLVPSPIVNGVQALRYNFEGSQYAIPPKGGGSAEWDYHIDQTAQREIWITWYSYMAPGFKTGGDESDPLLVGSVATKGIYSYMYSPSTGSTHGWVFHYFYGGKQLTLSAQGIKDARAPASAGYVPRPYDTENMWNNIQGYSQPDGQWIGYEAHFKLNTPGQANGVYELYVTPPGQPTFLASSYPNREFVDANNTGQMPGDSYWYRTKLYRQDGLGSMYIDRLTVTTTRVGFSGTVPPPPGGGPPPPPPPPGPLPDTSPPNAPTDLRVAELWNDLKQFVAMVWDWLGPASAEAAVPNDKLTLSWTSQDRDIEYDLRWQYFAHSAWLNLGLVNSMALQLVTPFVPPIECKAGQDCWVCADARAKRKSDGAYGPWLSETIAGKACNQFAVGPIVLPPPPDPVPVPTVDTFKNILETDTKLSFQYAPVDCPKGITKATSTTKNGLRTVTLTCAK